MSARTKAKKKTHNQKLWFYIGVVAIIVPLLVLGLFAKLFIWDRFQYSVRMNDTYAIRHLILNAVEGTKVDAPVDPKTGDVYFPQVSLYLPAGNTHERQLTYFYHEDVGLSISNKTLIGQVTVPLYNATNIKDLFAAVPKLQACSRGIEVVYKEEPIEGKELAASVPLQNGKTVYLYADTGCPELADTVTILKDLRSY